MTDTPPLILILKFFTEQPIPESYEPLGDTIQDPVMNMKLLIGILWIFFLAVRNTGETLWQFCLIYSSVLVVCAFFYQLDNKQTPKKGPKKK